jgi:hypothetical protein
MELPEVTVSTRLSGQQTAGFIITRAHGRCDAAVSYTSRPLLSYFPFSLIFFLFLSTSAFMLDPLLVPILATPLSAPGEVDSSNFRYPHGTLERRRGCLHRRSTWFLIRPRPVSTPTSHIRDALGQALMIGFRYCVAAHCLGVCLDMYNNLWTTRNAQGCRARR